MPDDDFEAKLERLRAEYESIGPDGDLQRRLRIAEDAAYASQENHRPVPQWAAFRVALRRREIHVDYQETFIRSRNPMWAIKAWFDALMIGDAPPDWAIRYIMASTMEFYSRYLKFIEGQEPNDPDAAFCESFGIKTGKRSGRGTIWTDFRDAGNDHPIESPRPMWRRIGDQVATILEEWAKADGAVKQKETLAVEEALKLWNTKNDPISRSTAWRAWKRYRKECPHHVIGTPEFSDKSSGKKCRCCPVHAPDLPIGRECPNLARFMSPIISAHALMNLKKSPTS